MKYITLMFFSTVFMVSPVVASDEIKTVERFVESYNQQELDAMLALTTPDIHWMSIGPATLSVETSDRKQLRKAMSGYFSGDNKNHSKIRSISQSANFVHTTEEAFWFSDGMEKSQCSMAIYELKNTKIKYVWYFPAHPCST